MRIDEKNIEDLRNLVTIIESSTFKSSGVIILNPGFGLASALVGGADADLLIDDLLLDIKTVKDASLLRGGLLMLFNGISAFSDKDK